MIGIKQTERSIKKILDVRFASGNIRYAVANLYLFKKNWETDYLVVQKGSGYCYEIEIKISRSDFFNDFKKIEKHSIIEHGTYEKPVRKWKCDPISRKSTLVEESKKTIKWDFRPNKFYYCVPEGLIKESEIPQYAGLMYSDGNSIRTVKEAKFIHKEKLNLEEKLCDKFYYYWKDEERTTAILEKIRDEYYEKTQNLQKIINESNKNLGNNTP